MVFTTHATIDDALILSECRIIVFPDTENTLLMSILFAVLIADTSIPGLSTDIVISPFNGFRIVQGGRLSLLILSMSNIRESRITDTALGTKAPRSEVKSFSSFCENRGSYSPVDEEAFRDHPGADEGDFSRDHLQSSWIP